MTFSKEVRENFIRNLNTKLLENAWNNRDDRLINDIDFKILKSCVETHKKLGMKGTENEIQRHCEIEHSNDLISLHQLAKGIREHENCPRFEDGISELIHGLDILKESCE